MKINLAHSVDLETHLSAPMSARPHCGARLLGYAHRCGRATVAVLSPHVSVATRSSIWLATVAAASLGQAAQADLTRQAATTVAGSALAVVHCDTPASKSASMPLPVHIPACRESPLQQRSHSGAPLACNLSKPLLLPSARYLHTAPSPAMQIMPGLQLSLGTRRLPGRGRSCRRAAARPPPPPPNAGLSVQTPPLPAPYFPVTDAKPWHLTRFIPELRRLNRTSLEAFRRYKASPKVAILNYYDFPQKVPDPAWTLKLRSKIGCVDALLLDCVGRDRKLDRLSIRHYDKVARAIGADAVLSPDDYIYNCDSACAIFQAGNLIRSRRRALLLHDMPQRRYSVIGVVAGKDAEEIGASLRFLLDHGIHDCAFPCGDYLKGGRRTALAESFVRQAQELRMWSLLLGAAWPAFLLRLNPSCFSNSKAFFGPAYGRAARSQKLNLPPGSPPPASPSARPLACLNMSRSLAGTLRR